MYEQALECYEGSLEITLPALGEDHPEVAALYVGLAGVCNKIGMYEESVGIYDKALAIYFTAVGPDHPEVALTYNSIGMSYGSTVALITGSTSVASKNARSVQLQCVNELYDVLDRLEEILSQSRFDCGASSDGGSKLTEVDIRLYMTLVRFDEVCGLRCVL